MGKRVVRDQTSAVFFNTRVTTETIFFAEQTITRLKESN